MIKVENLRKIYNPEKPSSSVGLYHVTFTLPSKGMIFVVGKSGSGKSTLLNILGGLDSSSGGNIIVDGNDFSTFSEKDFDNYRNNYLGFIFQDYHLIDSLTIKENIKLSLDLQGIKKTRKRIQEVLKIVELEGYENRYPRELSGGQQQRVAIARAIVKKPKLILADEPTGNLDSKTSRSIMQTLKKISKDTLVVVVSHNDEDAQFYADRVIELSDGRIIRDVERKSEEETKIISGNVINIPYNRKLNHEEQIVVNNALKTGKYRLNQQTDAFGKTKPIYELENKVKFKSKRMSYKNISKLSNKFTKGHYGYSIFLSILMSLLVILLSVCQIFSSFDGQKLVDDAISYNDDTNYILSKGYFSESLYPVLEKTRIVEVTQKDIENFYDLGYEGQVYKRYNKFLPVKNGVYVGQPCKLTTTTFSFNEDPYISSGHGVLECDKGFLADKFGVDGDIIVLEGSLDHDFKNDGGIIITDYFADSLLLKNTVFNGLNKEEGYKKIIETEHINSRYQVKAIIYTGYDSNYSELLKEYDELELIKDKQRKNEKLIQIKNRDDYVKFVQETRDYLSIGYFIDGNYYDAVLKNPFYNYHSIKLNSSIIVDDKNQVINDGSNIRIASEYDEINVEKGEILMPYRVYNALYGTNLKTNDTSEFVEKTIKINVYNDYKNVNNDDVLFTKTFKVTGVTTKFSSTDYVFVSFEDYEYFLRSNLFVSTLYFDNVDSISDIYSPSNGEKQVFYNPNEYFTVIYKIMDIVVIFNELFLVIILGLGLVIGILMASYSRRSVKRKQVDIGIFKAIGGENVHIFHIFFYQNIIITLLIIGLSTLGMLLFDGVINRLLIESLMIFLHTNLIRNVVIIKFDLITMLVIDAFIFLINITTSVIVLSYLKKMKPINIIRNNGKGLFEK